MNPILERIHPDDNVVGRRRARGFPPLKPPADQYTTYLHLEMWLCYLNGLDHAAVVTACALVEFSVKSALYMRSFVESGCIFDSTEWDRIERLEFGQLIGQAKGAAVITKDEWKELEWFRLHIRNVYMHGAAPDWLKDKEAEAIGVANFETGEVSEQNIRLRDDLTLQRLYRIPADRNACNEVVPFADRYARLLAKRSMDRLEEWKKANAGKPTMAQVQRVIENMQKQGLEADQIIMSDLPPELDVQGGETDDARNHE